MNYEAEMPGREVGEAVFRMICYRYYTAGQFVQGKQVLEVGCGAGLGLGYLAKRAGRVIGGDYAEDNIRCAQRHYQGEIELTSLNAHKLPFKDACFDVVVAVEVIQYFQLDEFLDECLRVLKSKGILIICIPNKDRPGFRPSPLSNKYYSAPELFERLNRHSFDAKLFGAFPEAQGSTRLVQRIWQAVVAIGVKILELFGFMPGMRKIRRLLKKLLGFKTLVLPEEIKDEHMAMVEDVQLVPLDCNSPCFGYAFLYGVAYAR